MASSGFTPCKNVLGTSAKFSRQMVLDWVNSTLTTNYGKIEQLCDGIAYCRITDKLFPGSVMVKKLVLDAKREEQYIHNLKILQLAFHRVKCDRPVPLNKLALGRFQDNWEFAQWFRQFVDVNSGDGKLQVLCPEARSVSLEHNIHKLEATRHTRSLGSGINRLVKGNVSASSLNTSGASSISSVSSSSSLRATTHTGGRNRSTPVALTCKANTGVVFPRQRCFESSSSGSSVSSRSYMATKRDTTEVQKGIEDISKEKGELETMKRQMTVQRDTYYHRLLQIEEICRAVGTEGSEADFCKKVLDIAYEDDDN